MSTTGAILPYATRGHIPTSGHARLSFWTGLLSFPLLFLLVTTGQLTEVDRLPVNKAAVLFFCLEIFLIYAGPLCALTYGTSALIRIALSRSILEGTVMAWAGIALGAAYLLVTWPL